MSAPVDVLAVMDEFIGCVSHSSARPPLRMSDARAAVAELIEMNRALLAEYGPNMTRMALASPRRALWMRLRDAVARIGGAA